VRLDGIDMFNILYLILFKDECSAATLINFKKLYTENYKYDKAS
jgi:hypothetical protein